MVVRKTYPGKTLLITIFRPVRTSAGRTYLRFVECMDLSMIQDEVMPRYRGLNANYESGYSREQAGWVALLSYTEDPNNHFMRSTINIWE